MKEVSWFEKYVVFNIYSKLYIVILSGLVAGLCLSFLFLVFLFFVPQFFDNFWFYCCDAFVMFGAVGSFAGFFVYKNINNQKHYDVLEYRDISSYWIFFLGLILLGYVYIYKLGLTKINLFYIWCIPLFIAFVFSNFISYAWKFIHCEILSLLFKEDYVCIVNIKKFEEDLRLKFIDIKRYGGSFSVLIISIDKKNKIIKKHGKKTWKKLNKDVIEYLDENTRETDVFGNIGIGSVIYVNVGDEGVRLAAKRILKLIKEKTFIYNNRALKIDINIGISVYTDKIKTPLQLIDSAMEALRIANKKGKGTVVYGNGKFEKEFKFKKSRSKKK